MLNYHRERFRKVTFRALALRQSEIQICRVQSVMHLGWTWAFKLQRNHKSNLVKLILLIQPFVDVIKANIASKIATTKNDALPTKKATVSPLLCSSEPTELKSLVTCSAVMWWWWFWWRWWPLGEETGEKFGKLFLICSEWELISADLRSPSIISSLVRAYKAIKIKALLIIMVLKPQPNHSDFEFSLCPKAFIFHTTKKNNTWLY